MLDNGYQINKPLNDEKLTILALACSLEEKTEEQEN